MSVQLTLSIVKPDAVRNHHTGAILARIEQQGLDIVAAKMLRLSHDDAARFYDVHRERPFFAELVAFMTSGPVLVQVLRGHNAVARYRELMPPKPLPAPCAPNLPAARAKTLCTVRTVQKTPPAKSPSSSPNVSCAADDRQSQPFRL